MARFCDRFCSLRKEHQLTLEELSRVLGVTHGAVSHWERGVRSPSDPEMYVKIASFFGVSADYLLGKADHRHGKVYKAAIDGSVYEAEYSEILYPDGLTHQDVIIMLKKLKDLGIQVGTK